MDILLLNLVPFGLAALMAFPPLRSLLRRSGMAFLTAGTMALLFLTFAGYVPQVNASGAITHTVEWVPSLGLSLSWYLDSLSLLFALIVTGIGVAVFFYAGYYFDDAQELGLFYVYMALFAGSMLALVLAGNVFMLFIAWEGTSVMSFLLIGFKGNKSEDARIAASRALIITGGGGLAMFVGLMMLGVAVNALNGAGIFAAGGFQLATILQTDVTGHEWYVGLTILIMLGAFAKSAQFPFHFWLPGAMTAPSPASAYLHSATMVKAGIYLLFRLYPTLGHSGLWTNGLLIIGLTTAFIGALFALRKRDLKGLLAYSTVSMLGLIVALIGLPEAHGLKAATLSIIAHALYKATFFLMAGTIEHATGTRNLDHLGGLARKMPFAFIIAALAGVSMAGYPPMVGFAAKELYLDEMLPYHGIGVIPAIVTFLVSLLTVVAAFLIVWDGFIAPKRGTKDDSHDHFHAPPFLLHVGPALLAFGSLIAGLYVSPLFTDITSGILGKAVELYIIPHNLNPLENTAFGLSLLVLIGGPLLFSFRAYWLTMPWINLPTGAKVYADFIAFWERLGDDVLKTQNGKLRHYLIAILGVVAVLMLLGGYENLRNVIIEFDETADILRLVLLALTVGATLAAILLKRHLLAALALGVSGYTIGGLFVLEPAPDVALVQFLVETMASVLIILMLARINHAQRQAVIDTLWDSSRAALLRDIGISTAIGVSVGLFALAAVRDRRETVRNLNELSVERVEAESQFDDLPDAVRPLSLWYLENAYPQTGAVDVVGAVVTDFRGMDTIIEITVFAMAALGVLTLLAQPNGSELLQGTQITSEMESVAEKSDHEGDHETDMKDIVRRHQQSFRSYGVFSKRYDVAHYSTPLTRLAATIVLPFALMLSMAQLFYGGGGPGDGFTAGVVSGLAVALWFVVFGYFEARVRLKWLRPGRLISAGLALALINAIGGLFLADGFLAITELDVDFGGIHFASTLVFETAIYLTVFGGITMIMTAIAHPGEAE